MVSQMRRDRLRTLPPLEDGRDAKIEMDKVNELASARTLLRCIDHPLFVKAAANQAARITRPDEVVAAYIEYWADPRTQCGSGRVYPSDRRICGGTDAPDL